MVMVVVPTAGGAAMLNVLEPATTLFWSNVTAPEAATTAVFDDV